MQNFSLENHHMMKARQPFCWSMTFTKVSNPFLPSPPKWLTWPLDVCGGVGWKNFFPNLSGVRTFSQTYNGVRFFFLISIIRASWSIFFSVQDIFLSGIYLHAFFLSKSVCRTFFLKSPITPSKVKWSAPKIHQTFGQLTDSDLSIISKGFWNNRGQNSLGERGGIRFYFPLSGESVRTGVRWRHNQNFSNG